MKISNSKKQLAKIIHENGGWRDGSEFTAQDGDGTGSIDFFKSKPCLDRDDRLWKGDYDYGDRIVRADATVKNWHQTILSRDEYFHLYPVAAPVKVVVVVENKTTCHLTVADKPTIEQLAADYRNAEDFAERKQQEADAAKADAEVKLAELAAAGKALGLVLSVAPVKKYTGKFYNSELGESPAYSQKTRDAVCDGCGKRYGEHYGDRCKSGGEG